jgi:hypothetical protein
MIRGSALDTTVDAKMVTNMPTISPDSACSTSPCVIRAEASGGAVGVAVAVGCPSISGGSVGLVTAVMLSPHYTVLLMCIFQRRVGQAGREIGERGVDLGCQ